MSEQTILIADDDRAIRTVLSQALGRAGYNVRATSSAATLWRWVEDGEGDLVITDVVMPDENGLDLVPRVLVSTMALTPLMVYWFIPLSTHLLANWLHPTPAPRKAAEAAA